MRLPYPDRFTLTEEATPPHRVRFLENPYKRESMEKDGYSFVGIERLIPHRPSDRIQNPNLMVMEKPGGEINTFSPELMEIWDRFIQSSIESVPPHFSSVRKWKILVQERMAEWFWANAPSRQEIEQGGRTPSQWVSEVIAELERQQGLWLERSKYPAALQRMIKVMAKRLDPGEARPQ